MRKNKKKTYKKTIDEKPNPRATTDSFSNPMARLGYGQNNLLEGTEYQLTRLSRNFQQINAMYRSHWIVRKIIDAIPEDMIKNWYSIKSQVEPELIEKLQRMEDRCMVQAKILEALKWGKLYGGAAAIMLIDGHQDILHEPLDYDTIMPGSFKGLLVVDRWSGIAPDVDLIDDINDPEFGLPDKYTLTMTGGKTFKVDHSRVLRFIGRDLPYLEKIAEQYWGISEIEVVSDELKKRDNTSWNIANLVFLANLRVMKQGDLGESLALGTDQQQQDAYNTASAQNALMSNMGMMLLDKDADFQTHQYAFSGLDKVYENFMCDLAGACEIPVTKLFGRAPAGMNATGESDMNNYYDSIEQKQSSALRPVLNKLIPVMCVSEWGQIPDDLDYKFNPVRTPKEEDKALLSKNLTDNVNSTYSSGLISQKTALKELKQQSDITGQWSNITDEDIEKADDTTNQGEILPNFNKLSFGSSASDSKDFDESEHKRDNDGKFSSGSGSSGSQAEKDCKLKNSSKETQSRYDECRKNERLITPIMNEIAGELGASMYGLEFSVKTASSIEDKIQRKIKSGHTEQEAINSMGDIVRYTQLCNHDKIAENTLKTVELLNKKGYDVIEIDNKYLDSNSDYKGVHLNVISPQGQAFELQIHSDQSMDVKNSIHPLYEEARNVKTHAERKKELREQMKKISLRLPNPEGIEAIKNKKG